MEKELFTWLWFMISTYLWRNFFRWLFILTAPVLLMPLIMLSMADGDGTICGAGSGGCEFVVAAIVFSFSPTTILAFVCWLNCAVEFYSKLCVCVCACSAIWRWFLLFCGEEKCKRMNNDCSLWLRTEIKYIFHFILICIFDSLLDIVVATMTLTQFH